MRKALLILIALTAVAGGMMTQRWLQEVRDSASALDVGFPDLQGQPHSLKEWQGKILIVNFWATWCPPCVEEMPEFARLQSELADKGVQFVGILLDDEAAAAREFLAKWPVNYPILDGSIGGRQWSLSLGDQAEVLPFSVVFDAAGQVVHGETGRFTRDEVMKTVAPLLE